MAAGSHLSIRALVTGGTRGIGLAVARALLRSGARVVITGRRREGIDEAVRALSEGDTGRLTAVTGAVLDVRDSGAVQRAVDEADRALGGMNVLLNNAGVTTRGDLEGTTDDDWARVIETNLSGPFYCTRAAIPAIRASGGGWIINIASLAGRNPYAGGAAYCASKAALIAMTESVMQEVRADGIRVAVILPGSVATGFGGHAAGPDDSWKLSPDDVAETVLHVLQQPTRAMSSRIEIRPATPGKG